MDFHFSARCADKKASAAETLSCTELACNEAAHIDDLFLFPLCGANRDWPSVSDIHCSEEVWCNFGAECLELET